MVREATKFFAWQRLRFIANASLWEMREVKEMDGRFWEVASCESGSSINQIVKERTGGNGSHHGTFVHMQIAGQGPFLIPFENRRDLPDWEDLRWRKVSLHLWHSSLDASLVNAI